MAETFNLPAVGDTMVEGEIVEWFVAVGDTVDLDQPICSIETDKSVVDMTTPFRGTVLFLAGGPGDVVEVGTPLIIVGEPGEEVAVPSSETSRPTPPPTPEPAVAPATTTSVSAPASNGAPPLSPVVRRLASENDVNLDSIAGSGPGGRITRDDVVRAIDGTAAAPAPATSAPAAAAVAAGPTLAMPKVRKLARERSIDLSTVNGTGPKGAVTTADLDVPTTPAGRTGERRERLSAMRRSIAAHLTKSAQEIPQFTSMVDADATALLATRKALAARSDNPVPIDAVLMALMVPVLREHPLMTAKLEGDEVVYFDRYDIGVAVDTPDGLMVPVVHGAGDRTVAELSSEILRLADAARSRTIAPNNLTGATCTLNNVGALGILAGTPILPVGTSVIVAFGKARPIVELRDGIPVAVPTITLSATFDHRLIDGGDSARFLAQLKQHLEVPALGLL